MDRRVGGGVNLGMGVGGDKLYLAGNALLDKRFILRPADLDSQHHARKEHPGHEGEDRVLLLGVGRDRRESVFGADYHSHAGLYPRLSV